MQNVRGAMQAQIQDLTAQLVASQQQCADLQAVAVAAASSESHVNPPQPHQHGPKEQQHSKSEVAEANRSQPAQQHKRQQHLRTANETARASQGSNASWRDALGLDSDSDADQAPSGPMVARLPSNTAGVVGPSSIGPAWKQKSLEAGHPVSAAGLAHHQTEGQTDGTGNVMAGLQLALTSSSMDQQALQSHQPLNPGALVAMPETAAMPGFTGKEVGWPQSPGPLQHAVRPLN